MIRLWFERSGRISMTEVKSYIRACRRFKKVQDRLGGEYLQWRLTHHCDSGSVCDCSYPSDSNVPTEPKLEDYLTEVAGPCPLSEMLSHPYAEEQSQTILIGTFS
jgi:hypothetical protein